jgi:hypothetical protein
MGIVMEDTGFRRTLQNEANHQFAGPTIALLAASTKSTLPVALYKGAELVPAGTVTGDRVVAG